MKKIKSLIDKLFFKLGYIPLKSQIPIGTIIKEEQFQMLRLVSEKEIGLTQIVNMIEPKIQTELIEQAMRQEIFQEATKYMEGQRTENPLRNSYQLKFILWVGKKKNNNGQISNQHHYEAV